MHTGRGQRRKLISREKNIPPQYRTCFGGNVSGKAVSVSAMCLFQCKGAVGRCCRQGGESCSFHRAWHIEHLRGRRILAPAVYNIVISFV